MSGIVGHVGLLLKRAEVGGVDGWDPLAKHSSITLSTDLLVASGTNTTGQVMAKTSRNTGVRQCEMVITGRDGPLVVLGFCISSAGTNQPPGGLSGSSRSAGVRSDGARFYNNGTTAYTSALAVGDVIGMVVDMTNQTIRYYRNGADLGQAFGPTQFPREANGQPTLPIFPACGARLAGGTSWSVRLRTKDFAYPVAGAQSWT